MPEPETAVAIRNAIADGKQREFVHKLLGDLLITIEDQYFKEQTLFVDGYRFINCRFENCTLNVLRGTFEFHHCSLAGGLFTYDAEALKCIQLFNSGGAPKVPEAFQSKKYPDGSFTIAKGVSLQ